VELDLDELIRGIIQKTPSQRQQERHQADQSRRITLDADVDYRRPRQPERMPREAAMATTPKGFMPKPKLTRSDRVFLSCGPGSSRSAAIDMMKAISAEQTGCIVATLDVEKRLRAIPYATTARYATGMQQIEAGDL